MISWVNELILYVSENIGWITDVTIVVYFQSNALIQCHKKLLYA